MTTASPRVPRKIVLGLVGGIASLAMLTACGPANTGAAGAGSENFTILHHQDMESFNGTPKLINLLGQTQCAAEEKAQPISFELIDQTAVDTNLTLLAGQDALPVLFTAPGSKELIGDFAGANQLLDIEKALDEQGVLDQLNPAALDVAKALYGDTVYTIPFEFNIEGFWYNKDIFAANGIEIPTTWDELADAAQQLEDAGVLPFSAAGDQGWPITRLLSGYLFRDLGADALQKVANGEAKLTDPEYVAAAQAIADLGAEGYFGEGVASVSYDAAIAQFLTGQAGIFYMGSWALGNFNDPAQNQIGEDAIGWFPVPTVDGGAGSITETPANNGLMSSMSAKLYDDNAAAWLTCIAENYGNASLSEFGSISAFKATETPADLPALTALTQENIDASTGGVLWFEALFNQEATTVSQANGTGLVTGNLTPEAFMQLVQDALDK